MRQHRAITLGLVPLGLAAGLTAQGEPQSAELSYKAEKKWSVVLPNETWSNAETGIPFAHAKGNDFKTVRDGLALGLDVDTDGDGRTDKQVKGAKGFLLLRAKDNDGNKLNYAVRFKVDQKVYKFAAAGMMRGKIAGESIAIIDQNNNGRYDDFGVDAMIVGRGDAASYLSRVVNLDGVLYEIEVSGNGLKLDAKPYMGETGSIDLRSGFEASGALASAVINSTDGKYSFQLADTKALTVPTGSYRLAAGLVTKASESATIKPGKMQSIRVDKDKAVALDWGGPIEADFTFSHSGETVKIEPTSLHYYGRAGEEYVDFLPQGASPKFLVYDERTEKLLKTGRFGT